MHTYMYQHAPHAHARVHTHTHTNTHSKCMVSVNYVNYDLTLAISESFINGPGRTGSIPRPVGVAATLVFPIVEGDGPGIGLKRLFHEDGLWLW